MQNHLLELYTNGRFTLGLEADKFITHFLSPIGSMGCFEDKSKH